MRLLAEAAAAARNPDKAHAAILEIQESTGELEKVVDSLLALTRYEAGIESPQPEPVDLCQNLRRQVESVRGRAEQRQLQIELELPAECWVYTDSTLAGRLFSNLLGNAMAHAPHGTTVRVCAAPNGDVEIANAAPLLTAADMPRLGERFYRVAVEGAENGHAGLGLSLATAMARVLGVNLAFTLRDDGWLVVKLSGFQPLRGSAQ
jgi:signal transduction histidine kinase